MRNSATCFFVCLCTLLSLLLISCSRTAEPLLRQESFVFGTRVEVLVYGAEETRAQHAATAVLHEFDRLHQAYHAWQPSELSRLNAAIAQGLSLEVSPELAQLIREAQSVAQRGDFLFDPGIGRLIALWGFQSDTFQPRLPDPQKLNDWRAAHPSIKDLEIKGNLVSSRNPQLALDFGGYLKGVALDHALQILHDQGINNALINIGGNIIALGSKAGKPWRVGIQHPRASLPLASLDLHDGEAIGTSGDYQRYFEIAGKRYSHLLDPRTAAPATTSQAVTVVMPAGPHAGMQSDAYSKPLFIAGDQWLSEAHKLGLTQALRIAADGRIEVTPALHSRLRMEATDIKLHVTNTP